MICPFLLFWKPVLSLQTYRCSLRLHVLVVVSEHCTKPYCIVADAIDCVVHSGKREDLDHRLDPMQRGEREHLEVSRAEQN